MRFSSQVLELVGRALFKRDVEEDVCDGSWEDNTALHPRILADARAALEAIPSEEPFIWICLVAANTEGDPDPDPHIRAWTANGARAAQLVEQGLDMVPLYRNPAAAQPAQATPQEVQEACAQVADRAALRCVRERIHGDSVAQYIAKAIRALIPPASQPSPAATVETRNVLSELMADAREQISQSRSSAGNEVLELAVWIEANGLSHFNLEFGTGAEKCAAQIAMIVTALRHMAAQPQAAPDISAGMTKAMEIVGEMRMSEAGILDEKHSGQRGEDRSNALYDAYVAIRSALSRPKSQ